MKKERFYFEVKLINSNYKIGPKASFALPYLHIFPTSMKNSRNRKVKYLGFMENQCTK